MSSLFDVLDKIRERPEMYLGGDEHQRGMQMKSLEQFLSGYSLAMQRHNIEVSFNDFARAFGAYLRHTRGWSMSCGPFVAIRDAAGTDEAAWQLFWTLVDEFRSTFSG